MKQKTIAALALNAAIKIALRLRVTDEIKRCHVGLLLLKSARGSALKKRQKYVKK